MPVRKGHDKKGWYWRWGNQKKYYYKTKKFSHWGDTSDTAKQRAIKQGVAIGYSYIE